MRVLHVSCRMADGRDEGQSVSLTPTQLSKAKDAIEILTYLTSAGKEPSNRGFRPTDGVVNPRSSRRQVGQYFNRIFRL